ncbi:MAG: BolA/IbaG family iron-sulfur metabolism protein [Gammaproteobacteria bacterium]|nr:BolA/IbaG family iron-sulfur metabolism protein [Gammaproteobacteria bacterium]NIR85529.1 BolA/IbaG family iron-sulfur metabolism protein [Gammaproteobacteria bacterium]NIR89788.1 BolA/IbaG family iron-sulfur metabolism protein [Gammaproteobacteria bacterium]NIU06664.1 BolA/IbaG family iron-sulfur metabolism protein [Gammaproteobacteria bacterium]NIV75055.1 BolA/IbaG family iron-sulfur metabolism protein [Gammaproteobacteria bacterium]
MRVQRLIEEKLAAGLDPLHLEVTNESHRHNVPPGSESHFKVVLVSDAFADRSLVQRHRMVHELLADPMARGIHALALHTYTSREWRERHGDAPDSPPCLGGGARKRA